MIVCHILLCYDDNINICQGLCAIYWYSSVLLDALLLTYIDIVYLRMDITRKAGTCMDVCTFKKKKRQQSRQGITNPYPLLASQLQFQ